MSDPVDRIQRSVRIYLVIFAVATWLLTILGIIIALAGDTSALAMSFGCGIWALMFTAALVIWEKSKP